jgi:hypothetical protein
MSNFRAYQHPHSRFPPVRSHPRHFPP